MISKSSYSRVASWYDLLLTLNGYRQGIKKFFARIDLPLPADPKILDVGCGTGLMSEILLAKFPRAHITAFDIDEKMVEQFIKKTSQWPLEKRSRLEIAVADLFKFTSADHFDLIVTGGVLESVPLQRAISHLKKSLTPNGILLNIALKKNWFTKYFLGYIFNLRPDDLETNIEALRRAGFNKINVLVFLWREFPVNLLKIGLWGS